MLWVWLELLFSVCGLAWCIVEGEARIRVQMSAVHSPKDVERCAEAFIEIGKAKGIIT